MKWWIVLFLAVRTFALPNLEEKTSEFVLETKKLEIPGYPNAFNPSITRWGDEYLLSFRIIPDRKNKYDTRIGVVRLDANFKAIGDAQILQTRQPEELGIPRGEDGRLIWIGPTLYLVYSDCPDLKMSRGGFRMHLAKLIFEEETFRLERSDRITQYEGADSRIREKSWTPFDFGGELFLAYSQMPHRIFRPLLGTGSCETISTTFGDLAWDWGVLRGGTAAQLEGDEYLSFFHSTITMASEQSGGEKMPHYFMGAYTFSRMPPFQITKMSPEPIFAPTFYAGEMYQPYHVPIRCIFPCGFVSDEQFIWVVYGRQDHESWVIKMDKAALLASLKPVNCLEMTRD